MTTFYKNNTSDQKLCPRCNTILDRSKFYVESGRKDGISAYCKVCKNNISREWQKNNSYDHRSTQIKSTYGVNREYINILFIKQNGLCAICLCELNESYHIDHNHKSKVVRGLLCRNCNLGLGFFKDNIDFLNNSIRYLKNN